MAERITERKWFWVWEFEKEERWLNEKALQGWALADVGFCRYTFERCEPGEYTIRLEMHPADQGYIDFMAETGAALGTLRRVLHYPAHDVYEVAGEHEYLIPAVPGVFIANLDPDAGAMAVHMQKGLAVDEN